MSSLTKAEKILCAAFAAVGFGFGGMCLYSGVPEYREAAQKTCPKVEHAYEDECGTIARAQKAEGARDTGVGVASLLCGAALASPLLKRKRPPQSAA